jgi:hypothetical protein
MSKISNCLGFKNVLTEKNMPIIIIIIIIIIDHGQFYRDHKIHQQIKKTPCSGYVAEA